MKTSDKSRNKGFVILLKIFSKKTEFVTIFGSARASQDSKYYEFAQKLASELVKAGFGVITGGGGGIMEAANKGAFLSGGKSIGINVFLPNEQHANPYCTSSKTISNLSVRKQKLIKNSSAFIIMPGGFGTLDEIFEVLTLVQTRIREHKIVFCGKEFYAPLFEFFENTLKREKFISEGDTNLYLASDDFEEIIAYIKA